MQSAGCLKWLNIKKLGDFDMQQLIATESASTASAAGMSFSDITPIPDQDTPLCAIQSNPPQRQRGGVRAGQDFASHD
jgi:hypothetical protein